MDCNIYCILAHQVCILDWYVKDFKCNWILGVFLYLFIVLKEKLLISSFILLQEMTLIEEVIFSFIKQCLIFINGIIAPLHKKLCGAHDIGYR